jgi:hypothetical protein
MRDQFRPPSPPKQEPITYKRSSRLDPKPVNEERQRKSYTVVKPVINDEFDKQVELSQFNSFKHYAFRWPSCVLKWKSKIPDC